MYYRGLRLQNSGETLFSPCVDCVQRFNSWIELVIDRILGFHDTWCRIHISTTLSWRNHSKKFIRIIFIQLMVAGSGFIPIILFKTEFQKCLFHPLEIVPLFCGLWPQNLSEVALLYIDWKFWMSIFMCFKPRFDIIYKNMESKRMTLIWIQSEICSQHTFYLWA